MMRGAKFVARRPKQLELERYDVDKNSTPLQQLSAKGTKLFFGSQQEKPKTESTTPSSIQHQQLSARGRLLFFEGKGGKKSDCKQCKKTQSPASIRRSPHNNRRLTGVLTRHRIASHDSPLNGQLIVRQLRRRR